MISAAASSHGNAPKRVFAPGVCFRAAGRVFFRAIRRCTQALLEAERCLYCYDAPCATACPTSIDVPSFIKRIADDKIEPQTSPEQAPRPSGPEQGKRSFASIAIAAALRKNVWPWIDAGRVKPVIYKVFPAAEAAQAHTLMESNQHIGKLVLSW